MVQTKSKSILLGVALVVLGNNDGAAAFSTTTSARTSKSVGTTRNTLPALFATQENDQIPNPLNKVPEKQSSTGATTLAVSMAIAMATATTTLPAQAYIPSDYASETVQAAIKDLKSSSGNAKQTFDVYEGIAAIITEGKGVGGQINYSK